MTRFFWLAATAIACLGQAPRRKPDIPRVWDDAAMSQLDSPLASPGATPHYPPASYYHRIPELVIYKSYPSRPPSAMTEEQYLDWLPKQEPEIAFDPERLRTQEDWIKAGELVFDAPMSLTTAGARSGRSQWRPWFIRTKGQLEKGPSKSTSARTPAAANSQEAGSGTGSPVMRKAPFLVPVPTTHGPSGSIRVAPPSTGSP